MTFPHLRKHRPHNLQQVKIYLSSWGLASWQEELSLKWNKSNSSVFSRSKWLQYSLRTSELMFVFLCFWRALSESPPWRVFPINCGGRILHPWVQNTLQAAVQRWYNWARSGTGSNSAVIAHSSAWARLNRFLEDSAKLMHHFPLHH